MLLTQCMQASHCIMSYPGSVHLLVQAQASSRGGLPDCPSSGQHSCGHAIRSTTPCQLPIFADVNGAKQWCHHEEDEEAVSLGLGPKKRRLQSLDVVSGSLFWLESSHSFDPRHGVHLRTSLRSEIPWWLQRKPKRWMPVVDDRRHD